MTSKNKSISQRMAEEICSVQPIDPNILRGLDNGCSSEEQLKRERYQPVSKIGLLWIKK